MTRSHAGIIAASAIVAQIKRPNDIGGLHTWVGGQAGTATLIDSGGGTTAGASLLNPPAPVGTYSVGQLDDISGNGRHIVQATSANQPTLDFTAQVNGFVPVKFDAVDDLMQTATAFTAIAQPFTIWIVCRIRQQLNSVYMVSGSDSSHQGNVSLISPFKIAMGATTANFSGPVVDTNRMDVAAVFNGASSILYVRGAATAGTGPTQTPQKWTLGARYDSLGFSPMNLLELAVFTKALSATEVAQLRGYAKAAYLIA